MSVSVDSTLIANKSLSVLKDNFGFKVAEGEIFVPEIVIEFLESVEQPVTLKGFYYYASNYPTETMRAFKIDAFMFMKQYENLRKYVLEMASIRFEKVKKMLTTPTSSIESDFEEIVPKSVKYRHK